MKDLLVTGGIEFMSFLSILFVIAIAWILFHFFIGLKPGQNNFQKVLKRIEYGKSIGLFALIVGFLGQMMGLIAMFDAVAMAGDINPMLVFNGIKVTMICPVYGILIYLITILLWFIGTLIIEKKAE